MSMKPGEAMFPLRSITSSARGSLLPVPILTILSPSMRRYPPFRTPDSVKMRPFLRRRDMYTSFQFTSGSSGPASSFMKKSFPGYWGMTLDGIHMSGPYFRVTQSAML